MWTKVIDSVLECHVGWGSPLTNMQVWSGVLQSNRYWLGWGKGLINLWNITLVESQNGINTVPWMSQFPRVSEVCTFHEHDRGKLFLFQKYAQHALVRRTQQPPRLRNRVVLNIWRLNKILTENEAVLPRLNFSQPQITWLFDSEFKLQLFRKNVSKS